MRPRTLEERKGSGVAFPEPPEFGRVQPREPIPVDHFATAAIDGLTRASAAIRSFKADEEYQDWLRQLRDRAFVEYRN